VLEQKDINEIDDNTLIMADMAKKALKQVWNTVYGIVTGRGGSEALARKLADTLTTGIWTHDYPISVSEAKELGLNVSTDMPREVYQLMALYPQPGQRRPSVQYIPVPYDSRGPGASRRGGN